MKPKTRRVFFVILLLLAIAVGFFYVQNHEQPGIASSAVSKNKVTDLNEFADLKSAFRSDSGYVRLISILSPV